MPRHPRPSAVVLLLLGMAAPAHAAALKLSTWNLNWLTTRPQGDPQLPGDVVVRAPADFTALAGYASILDADVIAFEEVDGPAAAAKLFPPGRYTLHLTNDPVVQRVGLAIRRTIGVTANPDDTALDVYPPGAAHPLRSGADVTLNLPGGRHLRILAVHLKTGCWDKPIDSPSPPARVTLHAQIAPLAAWIAARQAEGIPFAVMGDFNRVMDGDDGLLDALRDAAPLARVTEGRADPCWGGDRFIDHILLGGDAIDWLVPDSLRVLVYRQTDTAWKDRLSDHCPVSVQLAPP